MTTAGAGDADRSAEPIVPVVTGDEGALAAAAAARPGGRLRWWPAGAVGLARTLGLTEGAGVRDDPTGGDPALVAVDGMAITVDGPGPERLALAAVVGGIDPRRLRAGHRRRPVQVHLDDRLWFEGRATGVVIANAEFLGAADLAPRAHPGDGWLDTQVYALPPGQRSPMRRRLPTGTHVPHPSLPARRARVVEVRTEAPWPWTADGRALGRWSLVTVRVVPEVCRLML